MIEPLGFSNLTANEIRSSIINGIKNMHTGLFINPDPSTEDSKCIIFAL